jgi:septal ring factor EnvC (AmiA/AmiB activator)
MTRATRHLLAIALLGMALALPAAQQTSKQVEQQKQAAAERAERLRRQVSQDKKDLDRASRDLQQAERSVASARGSLRTLRAERAERAAARQKLVDQRAAREAERERRRTELANQLRAAYFMGRNEPLKLLLNQRKLNEVSRTLTYYGYFGRLRVEQIAKLELDMANIKELTARIDAEDAELAELEQQERGRLGELDTARLQRGTALASLQRSSRSRADQLARVQKELAQLEKRLEELSRATRSTPYDSNAPFARQRGRLDWPVAGRIEVDFGAVLPGINPPVRSKGIEILAQQGAEVRAVHEGKVIVADWNSARGLLVILDHGNGFWSLYGHNEQLFREEGARVKAGELIATVGVSGGRPNPGLYFEIRSGGKQVNPHDWFRAKAPPAR